MIREFVKRVQLEAKRRELARASSHSDRRAYLERILAVWDEHPELRFCQLLIAAADQRPNALFYVEDDYLLKRLERL